MYTKHNISDSTIRQIWRKRKQGSASEVVVKALRSQKPGKCGRPKTDEAKVNSALVQLPLRKRRTFRHASRASGFAVGTLWNLLQRVGIRGERNSITPVLTEQNEKKKLDWCLKFIDQRTLQFESMYNYVHLDEEWFYITKATETYLLTKTRRLLYAKAKAEKQ